MIVPKQGDFIDIHNHNVIPEAGVFSVDNIMVHVARVPEDNSGIAYSAGIHPWFLTEDNYDGLLTKVTKYSLLSNVIAIGEAGFDKVKGPSMELQKKAFEAQVAIANDLGKPLFIHNVKAWDELLYEHKKTKPQTIWIVHGFHGKKELASQLLSRGMYLSLWADFVLNRDSAEVIKTIPVERLFLETDAFDVNIKDIYSKVSESLNISVNELKEITYRNYLNVFGSKENN